MLVQTCQPSCFWQDNPAFLPNVPWQCPAILWELFCGNPAENKLHCIYAQNLNAVPVCLNVYAIGTVLELPFDFLRKIASRNFTSIMASSFMYPSKKILKVADLADCQPSYFLYLHCVTLKKLLKVDRSGG